MRPSYPANLSAGRSPRLSMKRLLAVLLLLAGGFSVEAVKPVQCSLIFNSRAYRPRPPQD